MFFSIILYYIDAILHYSNLNLISSLSNKCILISILEEVRTVIIIIIIVIIITVIIFIIITVIISMIIIFISITISILVVSVGKEGHVIFWERPGDFQGKQLEARGMDAYG